MLVFIERLANADGVYKRITKSNDISNTIKCNLLDKKNLLDPFRVKYSWYFKNKYSMLEGPKKKNFSEIMEMSSVWTEASQIKK